jgi:hypothetical protein
MRQSQIPPEPNDPLFDPRVPGKARTIYSVVAILVVIALIIGIGGFAVWDRLF